MQTLGLTTAGLRHSRVAHTAKMFCLAAVLSACESNYPLLPLPELLPLGPVTTAEQAIRIAINACAGNDTHEPRLRYVEWWKATRSGDQWDGYFIPRYPNIAIINGMYAMIIAQSGTVRCVVEGQIGPWKPSPDPYALR